MNTPIFLNREKELNFLHSQFARKEASFIVIYGRRRVGKTSLIKEFIKDKSSLFFMADKQSEKGILDRFAKTASTFLEDEFLEKLTFNTWEDFFGYITQKLDESKKYVLVIDEFQYLPDINHAFPSILQRIWDEKLKDKNIMLILCGSLINMMYSTTLSYQSPLYGRRTGQINLDPISFDYCHNFFPGIDERKLIEYYSVTGGIPKYMEMFDATNDILFDIKTNVLSKNSYLYNEPRFILNEEVTETATYFSILKAIAAGDHKIGKIASIVGVKTNVLAKYFNVLADLQIIERQVPVTEENPEKSKKGLYFIKDNFFRFWFRYVFPYQSFLEIERDDVVLKEIRKSFNIFVSFVYENLCLQKIPDLTQNGIVNFEVEKWGRWWSKDEEIDIVATSEKNKNILFGECKWSDTPTGVSFYADLKAKAKKVKWHTDERNEYYILFSKSGFTEDLMDINEKTSSLILIDSIV